MYAPKKISVKYDEEGKIHIYGAAFQIDKIFVTSKKDRLLNA